MTSILRNTLGADGRPAVDGDIRRYLFGHGKRDCHARYGENWVTTLRAGIACIPDPLADEENNRLADAAE